MGRTQKKDAEAPFSSFKVRALDAAGRLRQAAPFADQLHRACFEHVEEFFFIHLHDFREVADRRNRAVFIVHLARGFDVSHDFIRHFAAIAFGDFMCDFWAPFVTIEQKTFVVRLKIQGTIPFLNKFTCAHDEPLPD